MSFKPEFLVQGSWETNAQRFATKEEATASAHARFMVWTMTSDFRAAESDEPVNYVRVDGQDKPL
jgi:hypothetical protein